jgi:hypothetical protein
MNQPKIPQVPNSFPSIIGHPPNVEDIEGLIPPELQFQEGKGGLRVFAAPGGVMVAQLNKLGKQQRFDARAKKWAETTVAERYPQSSATAAIFGIEGERERMAIGMRSRLAYVLKHTSSSPEVVEHFTAIESLDIDNDGNLLRDIPDDPASLGPLEHKEFPRQATWVRMKPPPPTRYIAFSEKSIPIDGVQRRPDEVLISYELGSDELERIQHPDYHANGGFRGLGEVEAHRMRLHVGDPNLEIRSVASAAKHFEKTMLYLTELLNQLTQSQLHGPKLVPLGRVYLSARDVYLSHAMMRLSSVGASAVRWKKDIRKLLSTNTNDGSVDLVATEYDNTVQHVEAVCEEQNGQWVHLEGEQLADELSADVPKPQERTGVKGRLGSTVLDELVKTVRRTDLIDKALEILNNTGKK